MDWGILGIGIAIGIAVAAPIGPINLLCIQRSLHMGFFAGLATGLGAVLGDGIFAAVSAFGISWIAELVSGYRGWLQGIGGVALVAMGWKTMTTGPATAAPVLTQKWLHHGGLIGTTFLLTITNPATLFGFVIIFSGIGGLVSLPGSFAQSGQLVFAVMAGSFMWWVLLARVASLFQTRISARGLTLINRVAGLAIIAFGLVVLTDLLADYFIANFDRW